MELKNLCFGGYTYRILETEEDGEVRLFMLTEVDLEMVLSAMPESIGQAVHFRNVH